MIPNRRSEWLPLALLGLLLVGALGVRVPHLQWGLPDVEEEALPAKKAFDMWGWEEGRLQLDPETAGWPSLSFYVHLGLQGVQVAVGRATGRYTDALDFYVEYQLDPTPVITWARALSVALSLLVVIVAFRMGRRLAGDPGAIVAAALTAFSPMLVRHAQMVEPDMLLTAFAALAMMRLLDVLDRGRVRDYVVVAVLAGLGAASKYTPVLLTVSLYAVHMTRLRREGRSLRWLGLDDRRLGWAALASVLAFCIGSPYTFADLDVLRRDVAYQLMHMSEGHFGHVDQGVGYGHYLFTVLPRALGWPALLAGLAGLVLAWRRRDEAPAIAWAFLPYFVVLGSLSTQFDRYMLPLVLPLAVGAAVTVDALRRRWRPTRDQAVLAGALAMLLLLSLPVRDVVRYHAVQDVPGTQRAAADWITANLPREGTTIVTERYGPHLQPDRREEARRDPVFERLSEPQKRALLERPHHRFQILPMYSARVHLTAYYYDLRHFLAYDLIAVSGAVRNRYQREAERFPRQNRFYRDLESYCEEVVRFEPGGKARGPEIVLYRWTEEGRRRIVADRGALSGDHYLAFVDEVHAPDFLGFVEGVAVHAEAEEAWEIASTYYEILAETGRPEDRAWFMERGGIAAVQAGRLDRARVMFEWLLERSPRHVVALGNLGLIAERQGELEEARRWYLQCLEADEQRVAADWTRQRLAAVQARLEPEPRR